MSTTVSPASITEHELGPVGRADATAATPVVFSLAGDDGPTVVADLSLPFVKRSV